MYGGVGLMEQAKRAAASHILVATPGRLEDLLARRAFKLDQVRTLVLDEADRMLDMGFKPAVDRIVRACPSQRQTLFFSATLDGQAGVTARRYTTDPVTHEHGPSARRATADVDHRFVALKGADRLEILVSELDCERDLALVFVRTKHGADRLVKRLSARGIIAAALHGNKSQRQRERALASFASGATDTLVATDVAARGIDISGISHVINFDPPHDHDSYVHRVGRTGRAGRRGLAITLVDGPGERRRRQDGRLPGARARTARRLQRSAPGRSAAPSNGPAPKPVRHGEATNRPDGARSRRRSRSSRTRAASAQR